MSQNRLAKQTLIDAFGTDIKDAGLIVVVQQSGLDADQTLALRRSMRAESVGLKVVKNTLLKRLFKGTKLEGLSEYLKGPTAIAYSADPVAAAKVAAAFAKKNDKFQILAAAMGEQILDKQGAMALASLPSLDELRGKIVGLLVAPATKIAGVLQAPAGQLARVMSARSKQAA